MSIYRNALPPLLFVERRAGGPNPGNQANRWIFWMQPIDGDVRSSRGINGGMLYCYDSSKPIGSGLEFQNIKHIGYTYLAWRWATIASSTTPRQRGFGHQGDEEPGGIRDFTC